MQAARGLTLSSKHSSFPDSNKVFCKISNAIRGSNIQWRGRSFAAASVPSKSERCQKRVSKDERRAMVQSFVDKYRDSNAGKFPTPSTARKEVGGSYYVVKKIIQELEYQSRISLISKASQNSLEKEIPKKECQPLLKFEKVSIVETTVNLMGQEPSSNVKDESSTIIISNDFEVKEKPQVSHGVEKPLFEEAPTTVSHISNASQNSLEKEVPKKECQPLLKVQDVTSSETTVDLMCHEPSSIVKDESLTIIISNDFDVKEKPRVSTHVEKPLLEEAVSPTRKGDDSNCIQTYSHQIGLESDEMLHPVTEKQDSVKEETTSEGSPYLNGLKEEVKQEAGQETLESDKHARDTSRSTLWGNLRSFANGIVKFWRNG